MARRNKLTQRDIKLGLNILSLIFSGLYTAFKNLSWRFIGAIMFLYIIFLYVVYDAYKYSKELELNENTLIFSVILLSIFGMIITLNSLISMINNGLHKTRAAITKQRLKNIQVRTGGIIFLFVVYGVYAFSNNPEVKESILIIVIIVLSIVGIAGIYILIKRLLSIIKEVLYKIRGAITRKKLNNAQASLKVKQTAIATKQTELVSALTALETERKANELRLNALESALNEADRIKSINKLSILETQKRVALDKRIKLEAEQAIDRDKAVALMLAFEKNIKLESEQIDTNKVAALESVLNEADGIKITNKRPIGLGDFKKPNEAAQITPTNKLPASDNKIVFKTEVTQARKELDNLKKAAELFPERYDSARIKAEEKLADLNNKAKLAREQRIRLDVVFNQEKLSREFDQARVVREKRIKAEADIKQSKIAREKSKQLEAEVERIKVIETNNEKSEKIHAIQQARVARYNRVKAEADINQSKIAIQNAKRVSDLFSAQTEPASYKALNKETTLKILLTQANIVLENYIKLEAEQAANANKGTGLENDPFEANRKATAKKTVGLSVELNQASLALETQIKSESEASKVIETKSERPEYANNRGCPIFCVNGVNYC